MSNTTGGHTGHKLSTEDRDDLDTGEFAFPKERKMPINDATHVRNAIARFDQVEGVSDEEREAAFKRIQKAAKKFDVEMTEKSWRDLGKKPHTENTSHRSSHSK